MTKLFLLLITCLGLALPQLRAESGDPSDFFLNAYLAYQKGDKAEAANQFNSALSAYKQAETTLDNLSQQFPNWNPPMVKYRRERAAEAIARIKPKASKGADKGPDDDSAGPLPSNSLIPDELPQVEPRKKTEPRASSGNSTDPIREIQERLQSLQTDLEQTRSKLRTVTEEKEDLAKRYDDAIKETKKSGEMVARLQSRADLAEEALIKAESEGAKSANSSKTLRAEVETLKKQIRTVQIDREAAEELRGQLSDRLSAAKKKIDSISQERDAAKKANAEFPAQIASMQKELDKATKEKLDFLARLTKTEESLKSVTAERDDAKKSAAEFPGKLASLQKELDKSSASLKKVTTERDEALTQVERLKEAEKQVAKLLTDNTALMAKLGEAEKNITQFKSDGTKKDEQIAALKKDVTSAQKELTETQKQSAASQKQMADLQSKLEAQSKELTKVKTDSTTNLNDRKKLAEENELLRGIVIREMKEHARRDQTKKLVLGELSKLELQSKSLLKQIDYLGQPQIKLTEKESKLFKKPIIEISDAEISIAAPKEGNGNPADDALAQKDPSQTPPGTTPSSEPAAPNSPPQPESEKDKPTEKPQDKLAQEKPIDKPAPTAPTANEPTPGKEPSAPAVTEMAKLDTKPTEKPVTAPVPPDAGTKPPESKGPVVETGAGAPNVPPELMSLAKDGKEQFDRGNYRDAEKVYEKILAKAPNNLYALSNLGVVRFRSGKLKLAEEAFKKAIAVAPEDGFSHCTLGIIYYSQAKYDEAVNTLTKALSIQPKNATAHNYLGITASQKGWQEAAHKELETAIALDGNYADAFFNLAVVCATQQPPNKELARKHYKRATELGADPDPALEQLIK